MRKCYTTIFCTLLLSVSAFSQTRFWVGPSTNPGGAWSNSANWSASSGGTGGASVPNVSTFNVVFDKDAMVNVDLGSFTVNSIKVTNNKTAALFTTATTTINVTGSAVGSEGVHIDAGSVLRDSVDADVNFTLFFNTGSAGVINGDWVLTGTTAVPGTNGTNFSVSAGSTVNFNSGGRVICIQRSTPISGSPATLLFNSGSYFIFNQDGGIFPTANFNSNSTIRITGTQTNAPTFSGSPATLGNVEFNCNGVLNEVALALVNANILGSLKILNTNNQILRLTTNPNVNPDNPTTTTVSGDLQVSGNSAVAIANLNKRINLQVNGNFVQSGGSFSIQNNNLTTRLTSLFLKGNFTQTAGTFTANSTATSTSINLFVLEMNGTGAQTINASSGTIDNANNQVALRLNNSAGVTLSSPLSVGRMDFAAGNITTTNSNLLTINNTGNNPIDINGVSNSSYVSGPVKRKTAQAVAYTFPVGKGGVYRIAEIIPNSVAASDYTGEYFNSAYSNLAVTAPLSGVSNAEYWIISRGSGSSAAIRLTLNGAVPGAQSTDGIVVAQYTSTWNSVKGNILTPGTSTSGTVTSINLTSFSPFTFGFGPASALPVILKSFDVVKANGFNQVDWKVNCYNTSVTFEVERSFDGQQFNSIESISADQTRCLQPFDYKDYSAGQTTVYYRLKVVDIDGKAFYSRIVALISRSKGFEIVGLYPSLVSTGRLKVNVAASNNARVEFYITNSIGQIIKKIQADVLPGENFIDINVNELTAGIYQLTGFNNDGQAKTFRFIKQ